MDNINIQVYANRKLSKKTVDIGNMQESGVTKLIFELEEDIVALGGNVYLFASYDEETHPHLLQNNSIEIDRRFTQRSKTPTNIVVSTSSDLENPLNGVVWISNTLTLLVDKNNINIDSINEEELPPSLKIIYDELLALEKDLQEKRDADYWRGPQGEKGKSAYEYAVEGGFEGTEEEFTELIAQAGQDLTGYVTKEEHEAELLKAMVKVTTEESSFHHLTDTANFKVVDFGMRGITEQETTSGKNLLDTSSLTEQTINGVTFTPVYTNGMLDYVLVNGTATADAQLILFKWSSLSLVSSIYTCSGTPSNGSITTYYMSYCFKNSDGTIVVDGYDLGTGLTSSAELGECAIYSDIVIKSGVTVNNLKFKPQLELGSVATDYEPYTNGPSPNPTHPQEIELAGVYNEETGRYEHKCCVGNKNFANELISGLLTDANGTILSTSEYYANNFRSIKRVLPKGTYTIHIQEMKIKISRYIIDGQYKNLSSTGMDKFTFTVSDVSETIICFARGDGSAFDGSELVQLEYEGSITDYIEGKSQPFTLTSDRPLTKWDNLVKRDGVYGWSIWSYKNVYDENNLANVVSVQTNTKGLTYFIIENTDYPYATNVSLTSGLSISNKFIEANPYTETSYCMWRRNYELRLFIEDTSVVDKDSLNTWISNNPFEVWYKTAEEQAFIPLPDEEQTLLNNLETYYGVTNVYNEQGCPLWLTYAADQELHWNQKLLEIQQAII